MGSCEKHPDAKRNKDGRCSLCKSLRMKEYFASNYDYVRARRLLNGERERELARLRNAKNPESNRQRSKRWRVANPDKVKAKCAAYYAADPEKSKQSTKAWRLANREKNADRTKAWRLENKDKVKGINQRAHAKADKEKRLVKSRAWQDANRDVVRQSVRKWNDKHPERTAQRKAAKLNATPAWANKFFVAEAYSLATLRTKVMGFAWQVDHIVPLISKLVCGLHVEKNLRVIPRVENSRKGNRHWPDMPSIALA